MDGGASPQTLKPLFSTWGRPHKTITCFRTGQNLPSPCLARTSAHWRCAADRSSSVNLRQLRPAQAPRRPGNVNISLGLGDVSPADKYPTEIFQDCIERQNVGGTRINSFLHARAHRLQGAAGAACAGLDSSGIPFLFLSCPNPGAPCGNKRRRCLWSSFSLFLRGPVDPNPLSTKKTRKTRVTPAPPCPPRTCCAAAQKARKFFVVQPDGVKQPPFAFFLFSVFSGFRGRNDAGSGIVPCRNN